MSQPIQEKKLRLCGVSGLSERHPNMDGDHGSAIKSEAREAVEMPSVWENKCNLRVKRLDPLPKANDRWRKMSMPTLGYRNGRGDLNHYRSVFGLWMSADKHKTKHRSLTQQRARVKAGIGFCCGTKTYCNRSCSMTQRRGTDSQQSFDGRWGRPMPVIWGKRAWRAPKPHLLFNLRIS